MLYVLSMAMHVEMNLLQACCTGGKETKTAQLAEGIEGPVAIKLRQGHGRNVLWSI